MPVYPVGAYDDTRARERVSEGWISIPVGTPDPTVEITSQRQIEGNHRLPENRRQKRAKTYVDTPAFAAMCTRQIEALARRVAQEDNVDLVHFVELQDALNEALAEAIAGVRRSGCSDAQIAQTLAGTSIMVGATRQAVQKRWPRDTSSRARV